MLELTIEQISMGQSAVDKPAALDLLARHLVADGLVAEGYLAGDPIRYPLYVGSMFLAMPFQLIGVILGHPF